MKYPKGISEAICSNPWINILILDKLLTKLLEKKLRESVEKLLVESLEISARKKWWDFQRISKEIHGWINHGSKSPARRSEGTPEELLKEFSTKIFGWTSGWISRKTAPRTPWGISEGRPSEISRLFPARIFKGVPAKICKECQHEMMFNFVGMPEETSGEIPENILWNSCETLEES